MNRDIIFVVVAVWDETASTEGGQRCNRRVLYEARVVGWHQAVLFEGGSVAQISWRCRSCDGLVLASLMGPLVPVSVAASMYLRLVPHHVHWVILPAPMSLTTINMGSN